MAGGPPFLFLLVFARRSDGGLERVAEQGSTGSAVKATLKPMTRRRLQLSLFVVTRPADRETAANDLQANGRGGARPLRRPRAGAELARDAQSVR